MNATTPLRQYKGRTAPTARPKAKVGFTAGSLIELAALGLALLVPAVALGQERTVLDFGPDPSATARYDSNGGYSRGDQAPARSPYENYQTEPTSRTAPQPTPKPQPATADRLSYRYDDPKVVRFATGTGWTRLVNLYVESSQLIDARHREPNSYADRVAMALANLSEAVGNESFRQAHRMTADAGRVQSFRSRLAGMNARSVRDRPDALEVMRQTASLAQSELGLSADAVAAEFLFGAVESLDKFSGFLPSDTRTGYGVDATVIPAQYAAEQTAGALDTSVVGLGVELKEHERGVVIVKPLAGGPAANAGLQRGDVITKVDGQDLAGKGLNGAADLIVGREGTAVQLRVMRGERFGTFNLRRARVELKTVSVVQLMTAPDGSKVGYLKLDRFAATSQTELDAALWQLYQGGMKSLVMDLRGNPGGLLDQAISISDTFLPSGTIVSTRGRLAEDNMSATAKQTRTWKVPMAVIVDEGSASASEIFAAAIQDNRRGVIVGRNSYGKGTVQTHFPVRTVAGDLKLTTAMFYSPNDRQMADQGVAPDVRVSEDREILPLDRDADVVAAIKAATSQTAATMAQAPGSVR
ncbi:S41 family peptidase [Alienimonas californiensis]|uniref:Putative CtpA-like serine protease n=1 Tax=Alienimonas californiensis TaxID=2527989 RepID=A0A517PDQ8_9PLAN|nr:S41 family peptidase [Alienimonas californiensis]QDT17525.1 putative CtpA-like serine protease [Alienimonas californiensis]